MLLTLCAVMAGLVSAVMPRESDAVIRRDALAITIAIVVDSLLVGAVVGAHHFNRAKGIGIGLLAGLLAGIAIAPLCFASTSAAGRVMMIEFGGSTLLVVIAAFLRLTIREVSRKHVDVVDAQNPASKSLSNADVPYARSDLN